MSSTSVAPARLRSDASTSTLASKNRKLWLAPVLVGLASLLLALPGLTGPSIWYDEAATVISATRSLPALWQMLGSVDAVHGLYYLLMHALFEVFGYSEFLLRFPSAVAAALTAGLTVELGRRLGGLRYGVIAGAAFVLLPRVVWMAVEGRSYSFSALLAVALTLVLVLAVRGRAWWWLLYGTLVVLACVMFLYVALLVVAHAVTIAVWLALRRREAVRGALRWLAASVLAALLVLPFALEVMSQSGQVDWLPEIGDDTPRQVLRTQWFVLGDGFAIGAWMVLPIGVALLLLKARRERGLPTAAVLLPAFVVPTLGLLAATEYYNPVYSPRYVTFCTPFVALVLAAAVERLRSRVALAFALATGLALAVPQIVQEYAPHSKQNTAWDEVAAYLDADLDDPATTGIIYGNLKAHSKASTRVVAYSYPEPFEGTTDVTLQTPAPETGQLWETRRTLTQSLDRLEGLDTVYLVTSITRDRRAATTVALIDEGYELVSEERFTDIRVLKYEKVA